MAGFALVTGEVAGVNKVNPEVGGLPVPGSGAPSIWIDTPDAPVVQYETIQDVQAGPVLVVGLFEKAGAWAIAEVKDTVNWQSGAVCDQARPTARKSRMQSRLVFMSKG